MNNDKRTDQSKREPTIESDTNELLPQPENSILKWEIGKKRILDPEGVAESLVDSLPGRDRVDKVHFIVTNLDTFSAHLPQAVDQRTHPIFWLFDTCCDYSTARCEI